MNETIAAISTPIGISAISVVRMCGANALKIAQIMTSMRQIKPRYAYLRYIYNISNNIIDRGIVLYFKAPHSFNGEDIVEFQCHGGIMVAKNITDTCIAHGARLANAGEFSKIALLNGKMDMSMLENIAKLINAQSTQAAEILARNLKGELAAIIGELRESLIEILASLEALIDYHDEDLPQDLESSTQAALLPAIQKLREIYEHSLSMQSVIDGHRLIIIGKPNVGKSSILNRLLLKERAIVSHIAGTTRDLIQESLTIENQIIHIIDTAGIHASKGMIEKIGMQKTLQGIRDATIIAAVFDGSRKFNDEDILEILAQNKDKIIVALINKMDKTQKIDESKLAGLEVLKISSKDSSVFRLRDWIAKKITTHALNNDSIALTNTRQIECVKTCITSIENAKTHATDIEICSFYLREALRALDLLTMPFDNNEVLDSMFSTFCLGK